MSVSWTSCWSSPPHSCASSVVRERRVTVRPCCNRSNASRQHSWASSVVRERRVTVRPCCNRSNTSRQHPVLLPHPPLLPSRPPPLLASLRPCVPPCLLSARPAPFPDTLPLTPSLPPHPPVYTAGSACPLARWSRSTARSRRRRRSPPRPTDHRSRTRRR